MISLRRQVMRQYSQHIFRMQQYTTVTAKIEATTERTNTSGQSNIKLQKQIQQPSHSTVVTIKKNNNNNAIQLQQQALKQAKKEQRLLEQKKRTEKATAFRNYLAGLPNLQYPDNYKVRCTSSVDVANKYITELISNNNKFGLDLEWPPVFVKGQRENKVSLVQICSTDDIILIQLSRMKEIPSELRKFFERKDILKSGVNIRQDGLKIYRDYGIITNGLVELADLAEDSKSSKLETVHLRSLRALTGLFMEEYMPKGKVRISNWANANLSPLQIKYAANDAYASYKLYCILEKLCENPIRIKHLIDENLTSHIPQGSKSTTQKIKNPNIDHPKSTIQILKRNSS